MWEWFLKGGKAKEVVMYTRVGCHLCDVAWAILEAEKAGFGFHLSRVDVDTDTSLVAQYGQEVPVVTVDGEVRFRGKVNPVLLRRLLRS